MEKLRLSFDIGGVISKYPDKFRQLINNTNCEVFIITDMHDKVYVEEMLQMNNITIASDHIYCADYQKYGELCKAVLLKELKIDIFFDDFIGYESWDSSLGPAPIRLLVMPDPFKPYWHKDWKVQDESDFGRRVYNEQT